MKKLFFFMLFLFIIPIAFSDTLLQSNTVTVDFEISSSSEIIGDGKIESATVNLTFFPREYPNQQIISFDSNGQILKNGLQFKFQDPQNKINLHVSARVRNTNSILAVSRKINFPIENLEKDVLIYTKPSPTIDSENEDIIKTASKIVEGEDDLYIAVFKVADWTKNNINYNLSSLTADVSQKASWVLQNKKGVCDELTSLFIALLRSVGIPARFVSGIAYTNSELFDENWGPHGWAEVYFPQYGWVPFDVTYGEFGWIDPAHFKFSDSVDSDEPSTYYQWLGRNANIKTEELEIKTTLVDSSGKITDPLRINLNPLKDSIKLGSYNVIEASLENINDFYYATEVYLSKPKEVEIIGPKSRGLLLLPNEKKRISWIVKVDDNLDDKFSYTFPVIVVTSNNLSSGSSFKSSIREESLSFEKASEYSKSIEQEEEKHYSGNVVMQCSPSKKEIYEFEDGFVTCSVKNTGNIYLGNANVCIESQCSNTDLGISQEKNFTFKIDNSKLGQRTIQVTLKNSIFSKAENVDVTIFDRPKIDISQIQHPLTISYKGNFSVSFIAARKSFSIPKDVQITLSQNGKETKWNLKEMDQDRKYVVDFAGKRLKYGINHYKIDILYKDDLGNDYHESSKFDIALDDATSFQRAALFLNKLNFSPNSLILISTAIGILFIVIVALLFRRLRS